MVLAQYVVSGTAPQHFFALSVNAHGGTKLFPPTESQATKIIHF
jgi:hypothetical protein